MVITGKENYIAPRKMATREVLIPRSMYSNIVGLGGPNLDSYFVAMKEKGYTFVESWELDKETYLSQRYCFGYMEGLSIKYGDILHAKLKEDTIYDLDFCCTVKSVPHHCIKFRERAIFTFALRGIGRELTVASFFQLRNEKIIKIEATEVAQLIRTTDGEYTTIKYCDTSPMIMIAKNNIYEQT